MTEKSLEDRVDVAYENPRKVVEIIPNSPIIDSQELVGSRGKFDGLQSALERLNRSLSPDNKSRWTTGSTDGSKPLYRTTPDGINECIGWVEITRIATGGDFRAPIGYHYFAFLSPAEDNTEWLSLTPVAKQAILQEHLGSLFDISNPTTQ